MPAASRVRRGVGALTALAATALILTLGVAPLMASGADHLDAPSLGSISVNPDDTLNVSKVRGPLDINDVYVFRGADASRTVLVMTVNPAVNVLGPTTFEAGAEYALNVDWTGDAVADTAYVVTFGDPDAADIQHYTVKRDGRALASGFTNDAKGRNHSRQGVMAFAGVRSDPFFFDLLGFLGSVKGQGTRQLNDGDQSDFFAGLNTLAIVVEVPNAALGGNGSDIGVWATTRSGGAISDQMGRPAINTVFNGTSADKEAFNTTSPAAQPSAMGGKFRSNVIGVLQAFSALDAEGAYTAAEAGALADVLLPDVITYTVGSVAAGPLNGRGLADDVIDAELNIVTGGFAFAGRDGMGAIPTDGVGPHTDYLATFPYLGAPH
ncbi:MAG TPA: DUF4331 family protein [candidate division Zixibacteria bacterium]|nr:DUF4331 family protein [candidate division Zixibacteria bacterium]